MLECIGVWAASVCEGVCLGVLHQGGGGGEVLSMLLPTKTRPVVKETLKKLKALCRVPCAIADDESCIAMTGIR